MRHLIKVYGAFCSVYLFLSFCSPSTSSALTINPVEELKKRSVDGILHRERPFEVLLHYRRHGERRESLVDDPAFFLSPTGKHDPQSELAALIDALFADPSLGDSHPICRFPARSQWIIDRLSIPDSLLPHPRCEKLSSFLDDVKPEVAFLVFPSAHTNGPASMFGHTLIRIGAEKSSDLLSHAVNYAAHADDTNGLLYAFKGIFGLYPGYYSILPHFEKLKEYRDLEQRDVWEYRLLLTKEEVRRMALHVWELNEQRSDYFFFDENCSFDLLFLIEAARPTLRLAESYWERPSFWVIPVDTIHTLRKEGVLGESLYRPSRATRIRHRASLLPPGLRERARDMGEGIRPPSDHADKESPREKTLLLDLASDYVQYLYANQTITPETYRQRFHALLKERSRIPDAVDLSPPPRPPEPESGHRPGRVIISGGWDENRRYLQLEGRPAYHDILDPPDGYTPGAEINFMTIAGRYYPDDEKLLLERLTPVEILSLAPRDTFFKPVSWKVRGGIERYDTGRRRHSLGGRLETGGGVAWEAGGGLILSLFADADLRVTDRLPDGGALGVGVSASLTGHPTPGWGIDLTGRGSTFFIDPHQEYSLTLSQSLAISPAWGIRGSAGVDRRYDQTTRSVTVGIVSYF